MKAEALQHWKDVQQLLALNHRIIESLKLEKTSKIMKSNHQPNTTIPAKPAKPWAEACFFNSGHKFNGKGTLV